MMRLKAGRGFTIVELLIVIVVIAILASISIVAYTGIQGRARDSQRLQDMKTIMKALEVYKVQTGNYPAAVGTTGAGGWETSAGSTPFLNALATGSNAVISSVPVDPVNVINGSPNISRTGDDNFYFYHRYNANNSGCDITRGEFYILGVTRMDTVPSGQAVSGSEVFTCPTREWRNEGAFVVGRFVN